MSFVKIPQARLGNEPSSENKKKVTNRFRLILLCSSLLLFLGLYLASNCKTYGRIFASLLSFQLANSGIEFEVIDPSLEGLTLYGQKILFRVKDTPYMLEGENMKFRASGTALLRGTLDSQLSSSLYGGELRMSLFHPLSKNDFLYNVSLENIALHRYPLARAFGVNSGSLTSHISSLEIKQGEIIGGTVIASIKELGRSINSIVPFEQPIPGLNMTPASLNFAINILVPELEAADILLEGSFAPEQILIKHLRLALDVGRAFATGSILKKSGIMFIEAQVNGKLTSKGKRMYGSMLSNFAGGKPEQQTDTFAGTLSGPLLSPRWIWSVPMKKDSP